MTAITSGSAGFPSALAWAAGRDEAACSRAAAEDGRTNQKEYGGTEEALLGAAHLMLLLMLLKWLQHATTMIMKTPEVGI